MSGIARVMRVDCSNRNINGSCNVIESGDVNGMSAAGRRLLAGIGSRLAKNTHVGSFLPIGAGLAAGRSLMTCATARRLLHSSETQIPRAGRNVERDYAARQAHRTLSHSCVPSTIIPLNAQKSTQHPWSMRGNQTASGRTAVLSIQLPKRSSARLLQTSQLQVDLLCRIDDACHSYLCDSAAV